VQQEHVQRNGHSVAGFGVGALWSPGWRAPGAKLAAMERLVAAGRGDELVEDGDCAEPGGGIAPTQRTAREMLALLRGQEMAAITDPPPVLLGRAGAGLGHPDPSPVHHWPWRDAVVMSVAGAVTGWVLDEVAHRLFRWKRRR